MTGLYRHFGGNKEDKEAARRENRRMTRDLLVIAAAAIAFCAFLETFVK
jgi:hypothetical protein